MVVIDTVPDHWTTCYIWRRPVTDVQRLHFARFLRAVTLLYRHYGRGELTKSGTLLLARATYSLYGTCCMLGLRQEAREVLDAWERWKWERRIAAARRSEEVA